jgi:hypothetical protein
MVYYLVLVVAISCTLANFLYQLATDRDWLLALERTIFQLIPCFIIAGSYWNAVRVAN